MIPITVFQHCFINADTREYSALTRYHHSDRWLWTFVIYQLLHGHFKSNIASHMRYKAATTMQRWKLTSCLICYALRQQSAYVTLCTEIQPPCLFLSAVVCCCLENSSSFHSPPQTWTTFCILKSRSPVLCLAAFLSHAHTHTNESFYSCHACSLPHCM